MNLSVTPTGRLANLLLAAAVMLIPMAQQPVAQDATPTPVVSVTTFSQQDLDEILAPIALYPDALLAQVFMASTYPMEIVQAARWMKSNPDLEGTALEDALQEQPWDPAVKSITAVPQVLTMMDEKLEWTQKLGDAFLAQQEDVMRTVQSLRGKAKEAGNLKSTSEQTVKTETQAGQTVVIIESSKPDVVYVPTYAPSTIYGTWWYSYPPPYYYYPPGYTVRAGLWFATGVIVGGAIWGGCNWGRNDINININKYNSFNRTNIKTGNWKHNPQHRKGVAYRDQATAQKFNRGRDKQAAQSREQFRGRAEQGGADLKGMDRSQLEGKLRTADRAARNDLGSRGGDIGSRPAVDRGSLGRTDSGPRTAAVPGAGASRDLPSRAGSSGNISRGGGFSGVGSGASTRASSARGNASLGFSGGGARGGIGGRR